jgi:hypothetical protein
MDATAQCVKNKQKALLKNFRVWAPKHYISWQPRMYRASHPFLAAVSLGLLWGLWHFPAINYLGAVTPHGNYFLPYFFAFVFVMTPIRVLICWVSARTRSVLLAQIFHASSTGFLVLLSPTPVTAANEIAWYLRYSLLLWILVLTIGLWKNGKLWGIADGIQKIPITHSR